MSRCKDCSCHIYVDHNMVMLKDRLWESLCDAVEDILCDKCIEKRLGRKISVDDLLKPDIHHIPCNEWWLIEQKKNRNT